jgi:hypothetical protein
MYCLLSAVCMKKKSPKPRTKRPRTELSGASELPLHLWYISLHAGAQREENVTSTGLAGVV